MEKYVCADYLGFPQTKLRVQFANKGLKKYNAVSVIGIPEPFMKIISCNECMSNTKSSVILSCRSKFVDYYPSRSFVLY